MRIIEQEMLRAIRERRNWRRSNTRVEIRANGSIAAVFLFENLIALVYLNVSAMRLSSAGWHTATTKSRLNALLEMSGRYIYQRQGVWYWYDGRVFVDEPLHDLLHHSENICSARAKAAAACKRDRNLFGA